MKDIAYFSKRAKEPTVTYEEMLKKLKTDGKIQEDKHMTIKEDLAIVKRRSKSAKFVGHKGMKAYLQRRGIKLDSEEKEILKAYERGELKSVKDFKEQAKLIRRAASHALKSVCNSKKLK